MQDTATVTMEGKQ